MWPTTCQLNVMEAYARHARRDEGERPAGVSGMVTRKEYFHVAEKYSSNIRPSEVENIKKKKKKKKKIRIQITKSGLHHCKILVLIIYQNLVITLF